MPLVVHARRLLARDDDGPVSGCFRQVGWAGRITGEDPVAGRGEKHDGRVDGVGRARGSLQDAGVSPILLGYRADVYRAQKPGQIYLPSMAVTPPVGTTPSASA
jgi:hypothetical protein